LVTSEWLVLIRPGLAGFEVTGDKICPFRHNVGREQIMQKLKNGWVEGSVKDFLNPSETEIEYIELRLKFVGATKRHRSFKK
jgi:hypothetical protein